MGVILDTSIFWAAELGRFDVARFIKGKEDEPFGISIITVSDLLEVVQRSESEGRRLRREAFVEKIIETFPVHNFDTRVARIHASLRFEMARKEVAVHPHDLIVAATAISAGYSVATMNFQEFSKLDGITIEDLRIER